PSISVKMILTTTALMVLIVVGFGLLNIWTIGRVYDDTVAEQAQLIRSQLHKVGTATAQALAASARTFLEGANDADLRRYVGEVAKKDPEISFVYGLDGNYGLIAHTDPAKQKDGHPTWTDDTLTQVVALWKARKDKPAEQDPLVAEDLEHMALFALPVFPAGVPATVANALADSEATKPLGFVVVAYSYDELAKTITCHR